jgi:hypothetical protein
MCTFVRHKTELCVFLELLNGAKVYSSFHGILDISRKTQHFNILKPEIYFKCYIFAYSQISPSGAEIKNEWSYTSVAPVHPHGECRYNFTPSFADIMTTGLPPLINSSLWTQRY